MRIKNGSYTVESAVGPSVKGDGQQHIPTVTNTGALFKCGQTMRRLLTCSAKQKNETKIIMEGINLVLEEGKMYLILGGESIILKI